jgi:hypothetical protein
VARESRAAQLSIKKQPRGPHAAEKRLERLSLRMRSVSQRCLSASCSALTARARFRKIRCHWRCPPCLVRRYKVVLVPSDPLRRRWFSKETAFAKTTSYIRKKKRNLVLDHEMCVGVRATGYPRTSHNRAAKALPLEEGRVDARSTASSACSSAPRTRIAATPTASGLMSML